MIAPFEEIFDEIFYYQEEQKAIEVLDFEKAQEIHEEYIRSKEEFLSNQKQHYLNEKEQLNSTNHKSLLDESEKKSNSIQDQIDKVISDSDKIYEEIVKKQHHELDLLQEEWENAREQAKQRIEIIVNSMNSTSQELARAHFYEKAIELREKAKYVQSQKNHPELISVNDQFEQRFNQLLERQKMELYKHQKLKDLKIFELKSQLENENLLIQKKIENLEFNSTKKVMETVLYYSGSTSNTNELIK